MRRPRSSLLRGIAPAASGADTRSVRRTAALATLVALVFTAVAVAGPPRLEQKRLRAADVALAKRVTLKGSDFAPGWTRRAATGQTEQLPQCPGADLDFSAFTITGQARSAFGKGQASVQSLVEVFKSRRDAAGDFRKATAPKVVACLGPELERQGRQQGLDLRVLSARTAGRPAVGERAFAVRFVMSVAAAAQSVRLHMDVLGVQRGRSAVTLFFAGTSPVGGQLAVARSVAARMR
jgi:hypothetical protein